MIHFNELYVTDDGKKLVIDAAIDDMPEYDNFYINSIKVDIGSNCRYGGKSVEAVEVYKPGVRIVGDLNNDGVLGEDDVAVWTTLLNIGNKKVYTRDDGTHYYKVTVEDEDTGDNIVIDADIDNDIYAVYRSISLRVPTIAWSGDTFLVKLLDFIWENIGDASFPNAGSTPGDLTGNDEVNIEDVNAFINGYILAFHDGLIVDPITVGKKSRHVHLCLGWDDGLSGIVTKDFTKTMFIVTATATADTEDIVELECGQDVSEIVGVAYNTKPLYDAAMKYAANYGNTCDTRDANSFIDFLMRYYGFLFALKCGDLCQAQYYWSNYLTNSESMSGSLTTGGCGCHGTYG